MVVVRFMQNKCSREVKGKHIKPTQKGSNSKDSNSNKDNNSRHMWNYKTIILICNLFTNGIRDMLK